MFFALPWLNIIKTFACRLTNRLVAIAKVLKHD
jgi:hypothetical protein